MKLSLFTPTHNPRFLRDCHRSLVEWNADFSDWEWLIVPNGDVSNHDVTSSIGLDNRVRVVQAPTSFKGVGALKRFACELLTGDVFVEFDHDDQLLPGALKAIADAALSQPGAFYYSDTIYRRPDGQFHSWFSGGWRQHKETLLGEDMLVTEQFDVEPSSLCDIYFAPDHVRAWSRSAYARAGGHDANLVVADDQDLMCRTYIAGIEFVHINKPLYLYRYYHAGNVSRQDSPHYPAIQNNNELSYRKHAMAIAKEWSRRKGLQKLDLGGTIGCPDGFTPVDRRSVPANGIQVDLSTSAIPLPDNSVGLIRAVDFLEHIPIGRTVPLMNDIYRVLAPGGMLMSATPSTDGRGAWQDPTHCSFWNENSFWYYLADHRVRPYVPDAICRFGTVRLDTGFPSDWHRQVNISYVRADLVALKGQRCARGLREKGAPERTQ